MKPVLWLNLIYAAVIAAISLSYRTGADRFWLGALNLYLPQVMWAVPGIILVAATWKTERPWVWLPLCLLLWVIGPVMGYNIPPNRGQGEASGVPIRVMTWNIKYGKHDLMPLVEEMERSRPDIVLFQDAVRAGAGPLAGYFRDWHLRSQGQYLVASRYPLTAAEVHELPYSGRGKEYFLRCKVRVGSSEVSVYDVHFKTPRRSLNAFRKAKHGPWYLPNAIQRFEDNVSLRLAQAMTVAGYLARETGPVLVAGDMNSPDPSLVCRTLREAGLTDAFAAAGTGYGYTYGHFLLRNRIPWLRLSWMRIDHIMTNSWLTASRCRVGTGRASDHRPVVADFFLKDSP
ncbi:endonuclease/exonuclease/phosphatase [Geoanaerobacter pelophilus]|uniref:Endonuclease/exonuclease/phosphatase n=1 Tax=Geoanaerobacter pelophilus TaxID=60036 RepID=A0ABQ0MMD2_9BACT|nr:endonuclease/exonuclease/phosphatase family protein [Geoanaerobacter pelophilus]GAW67947.1 endonuclease/exonuclease/phosphatase [Geoanaerobacter pelophilus]